MSILPVRFPAEYLCPLKHDVPPGPRTPFRRPLDSTARRAIGVRLSTLPTDPEAINYPNKTLVSVSATGGERREQCVEDARYCAKHFAGHVVLSPFDVVLARLGTSALVDKLAELKKVARTQLNATLKDAVLANLSKESIPSSKPADRAIDNRYWLSRLADLTTRCSCSTTSLPPLRSCPSKSSTATTRRGNTTPPFALPQQRFQLSLTSSSTSSSPKLTHRLSPLTLSSVRAIGWPSTNRLSSTRTTFRRSSQRDSLTDAVFHGKAPRVRRR
ncbi:hypothetical protein C8R44DRAFT_178883 [Mycena epipterygia]|nr:hypothetical protein C8R44DRAFT_178883 [Mycena epipterygia]